MRLLFRAIFLGALALYVGSAAAVGHSADIPALPAAPVVDLAGIVDNATEARLNRYLKELEAKYPSHRRMLTIEGRAKRLKKKPRPK